MAVIVRGSKPAELLRRIQEQIEKGHIKTWISKNSYLTHNNDQWRYKAWMQPKIGADMLVFYIKPPKNGIITNVTYAIYHGRIAEMLLSHFDSEFSNINLTSLPLTGDVIKSKSSNE